jgi:hypothetical protein
MTWTGAVDGWVVIQQGGDDAAMTRIQSGYTAIFTPAVPGGIAACVLIFEGSDKNVLSKCASSADTDMYLVPAGKTVKVRSPGPNGGFLWKPSCGYGYRTNC